MRRRRKYIIAQTFLRVTARLLYGYEVHGVEHVPLEGAVLLAANHKSYLDPPLTGACLPREIRYFAKKELFHVPLLAPLIRVYGAIPVERGGFDRKGLAAALAILQAGQGLLVFPEGTRIRRPGLADPKEGIGLLACKSGAPIVPVFLRSTWEPRRRLFRRVPVRICFGPPLRPPPPAQGQPARERYRQIALEVMERIRALAREVGGCDPEVPENPIEPRG